MTKGQAEQIYALMARPEWQAFVAYKQDCLHQLHECLEWETPEKIKKLQGQITEVKRDINLQNTVNDFLKSA